MRLPSIVSKRAVAVGAAATAIVAMNLAGTPASAEIAQPVQWDAVSDLSTTEVDACQPEVASSADGKTLTLAWFGFDDDLQGWVVQARRFQDGAWGQIQTLSDATDDEGVCGPRVVSSADGANATVVWSSYVTGADVVRVSRYENGQWSSPQTLAGSEGEEPPQLSLASSTDGHKVTVVWANPLMGTGNDVVRMSRYVGGSGWSAPQPVSDPAQDSEVPDVASSADGEILTVAWANYSTTNDEVQVRKYQSGAWNTVQTVSDPSEIADLPQVTQAADGSNATVVWRRTDSGGTTFTVQASRLQAGAWGPVHDLATTGGGAGVAELASSADGATVTALWTTNDTDFGVQASRYRGGAWESPQQLAAPGEDSVEPQLASSADGQRVTAVWTRLSGGDNAVQTRTLQADVWGAVQVLSAPGDATETPQVASSADGRRITAVWSAVRVGDPGGIVQSIGGLIPIPPPDSVGRVTGVKFRSAQKVRIDVSPAAGVTGIEYRVKVAGKPAYSVWQTAPATTFVEPAVKLRKGTWIQLRATSEGGPSAQVTQLFVRMTGGKFSAAGGQPADSPDSRGDVVRCSRTQVRSIAYTAGRKAKLKVTGPASRCVTWRHTKPNRTTWARWRAATSSTLTTPKLGTTTGKIQVRAGKRTTTVWTYYPRTI